MIKNLKIKNFKSIKDLELDCRRVNIFIGRPGTGKSNILEAIGLLSHCYHGGNLKEFVRLESMPDLFFENRLEEPLKIEFDGRVLEVKYERNSFLGYIYVPSPYLVFNYDRAGGIGGFYPRGELSPFKLYRFNPDLSFVSKGSNFLLPPSGVNLPEVLRTHPDLRELVGHIFSKFPLKLVVEKLEDAIKVGREISGVWISYPYRSASETLRRLIFYLAASETCRDSVLAFEEPEAHAFPYYTKYLAELIASDESNQYFISTHNPYFLSSMIEKAPGENLGVYLTYFEDFRTKVKLLSQKEMGKMLDFGPDMFFNIDEFLRT